MDEELVIEIIINNPNIVSKAMKRLADRANKSPTIPSVVSGAIHPSVTNWLKDGGADSFKTAPQQAKVDVRKSYERWCDSHGWVPLREIEFGISFRRMRPDIISKQVRCGNGRHMVYERLIPQPIQPEEDLL